jgi:hypothetical protein
MEKNVPFESSPSVFERGGLPLRQTIRPLVPRLLEFLLYGGEKGEVFEPETVLLAELLEAFAELPSRKRLPKASHLLRGDGGVIHETLPLRRGFFEEAVGDEAIRAYEERVSGEGGGGGVRGASGVRRVEREDLPQTLSGVLEEIEGFRSEFADAVFPRKGGRMEEDAGGSLIEKHPAMIASDGRVRI